DGDNEGINGCVSVDPLFVDATYFHLRSNQRNYIDGYFSGGSWSRSAASEQSPLIDAGDPTSDYSQELLPSGYRINMGAYGNTSVASYPPYPAGSVLWVR
ncbi:hypothetical protein ACFLQR_04255, partial [Verrucomicrobiota bacterium]